MNSLKLITTERFGNISCDFYRNMNDDILLTREQIGTALEYTNPDDALSKIHKRHKDRLDQFSVVAKLSSTDGKEYDTYLYTQKGVMEICRWSTKKKANQFMDWCWDVIEKYRNNQGFTSQNNQNIELLTNAITALTQTITTMQQDISYIKATQLQAQKQIPKKSFSRWTSKMFPKYQLLMDYFSIDRKELYHNLFLELQNIYPDIDLVQMQEDYCFENGLERCYTMDVIEHNKDLRTLFEHMVDDLLDRYKLKLDSNEEYTIRKTIFI